MAKISDILWNAANKHLWDGVDTSRGYWDFPYLSEYSCFAIKDALHAADASDRLADQVFDFIEAMGVKVDSEKEFPGFKSNRARQHARYNWLMFAYKIAEEEGK